MQVKDIMRRKFYTINDNATFEEALKVMCDIRTNSLLVVNSQGEYVGFIDSYKLIKAIIPSFIKDSEIVASIFSDEETLKDATINAKDKNISEFMNKNVETLKEDDNLVVSAIRMLQLGHQRVPVIKDKKPVGLITRTEMKRVIASYLNLDN